MRRRAGDRRRANSLFALATQPVPDVATCVDCLGLATTATATVHQNEFLAFLALLVLRFRFGLGCIQPRHEFRKREQTHRY